ncbi:MAG TPA: DAK2 domain-containing protein [Anaerolineaceae bacterium]
MNVDEQFPHDTSGQNNPIYSSIDGQRLKVLIEASLAWLKTNQQIVNDLNIFPVPDGDTGTNMVLTMQAAYNEISSSGEHNVGRMAHAVAQGALMGARGNSGVILSQIWRGFARALDNLDTMDTPTFVRALGEGRNTAYKGIVRPVEGTILTVAKDIAAEGEKNLETTTDFFTVLENIVQAADVSVKHTPELLPILKQAGVVDSGGKGLFYIFEGMLRYLKGQSLDIPMATVQPLSAMTLQEAKGVIEPGQDYEVVVDFTPDHPLDIERFYNELTQFGTSIQVGEGDGMYRMHIHVPTEKRYYPIDYTMKMGTVTRVMMENLIAQVQHKQVDALKANKISLASVEPGQIAVVAISPGIGITRIFASLGVAAVVDGGQTMNPSTEEILKAFENLPTDHIIILPNNKNIILAAQTASNVTVKNVKIVPCTTIPQGLAAMLRLSPDGDLDKVFKEMTEAIADVDTGEITIATRSVKMNRVQVKKGEVIALYNGKLVYSASSIEEACLGMLAKANVSERERITLFYGSDLQAMEVNRIADKIRSVYPTHEVELHEGGQPHYQLIVSIE